MSSRESRLRVLVLLPHVPGIEAWSGGARANAHLIAGLSARHDVSVLCLRRPRDPAPEEALRHACVAFEAVPADAAGRRRADLIYRARFRISPLLRTPRWAVSVDVPAYRARLRCLIADWRPDVVHVGNHVMGQYIRDLAGCDAPVVLALHEPGSTAARDAACEARGWAAVRAALETRAWIRYERRILRQCAAVVVLTDRDRQVVEPLTGEIPVRRIPLGVAWPPLPLDPIGGPVPQVVFIGGFGHRPNVDAALRLIGSVFPLVLRARPDAHLLVVGAHPPPELHALAGRGITVTGAVASVEPFLDAASVVVAPLRTGGGMRVKVLEALAAGKAVVASPLAVEGLDVAHGRELLIGETDAEIATAVIRLLDRPDERARLARRARTWAQGLTWDRAIAHYEALYGELVAERRCAGGRRPAAAPPPVAVCAEKEPV